MVVEIPDIGFLTKPAIGLIDLILANVRICAAPGDEAAGNELANILQITQNLEKARNYINSGERVAAMDIINETLIGTDCAYLHSRPIVDKNIPEACRTILIYQIQQQLLMLRQLLTP